MQVDAFLAELEPLTHRARTARMVGVGDRIRRGDDPDAAALADALERHDDAYARLLAISTVWSSRDGERVLRALRDPSRAVRARAASLVALACDDAQAQAALGLVPPGRASARLATTLRRRRRDAPVDAFLAERLGGAARPEGTVVALVAIGSAGAVARHAATLGEHGGPVAWQRLAKWQPLAAAAALPALATSPEQRMRYGSLLPLADARVALAAFLGHPEGEQRAAAQRALLASVRLDETSAAVALAQVRARRFEQDPVRRAMLGALAELPRRCLGAAHLEAVGAVVQDALDAADLSSATAAAAEQIVVRLFHVDAAWSARWLAKILAARGGVSWGGLGDALTLSEVRVLAPALAELSAAWRTSERAWALIWLARGLDRRLGEVPALLDALETLAAELPFVHVAAHALDLLRRRAGGRFAALVPRLLAADASFAVVGGVARFVSMERQDLLDPLLVDAPMTGRFATGQTRWAIDFGGGYVRWTARQQRRYAEILAAVAADRQRDVPGVGDAVERLARLAFAPPDASLALASDERPAVRDLGVRALPWLDGGQGVGVLLACLDDDRARTAIYALRKALREMSRARAVGVLRDAPRAKVTVAKEVVRVLGEMGGDEGFADLVALDAPGLHRDVRIALLRALWDHLDRPEAWAVFERAAADPDAVLASRLADIPVGRLSTPAEARLCRLLARVLERPETDARLDLLRRVAALALRDGERVVFGACLARMAGPHPDECSAATAAALTRMLPDEADVVVARVRALLPERRLLGPMVEEVGRRLGPYAHAHARRVGEGVLAALAADPLAMPQYVSFAPMLLGSKDLASALASLADRDLLHADAMAAAFGAVGALLDPERFEAELAGSRDVRLRRLAVTALVAAAAPEHGWTKERRARLEAYRADASPLVAGAATFVFPPD